MGGNVFDVALLKCLADRLGDVFCLRRIVWPNDDNNYPSHVRIYLPFMRGNGYPMVGEVSVKGGCVRLWKPGRHCDVLMCDPGLFDVVDEFVGDAKEDALSALRDGRSTNSPGSGYGGGLDSLGG